jgi:hypothetical protein
MTTFPNAQNNSGGAIPVYVTSGGGGGLTITNRSATFNTGSTSAVPANANRRYLFIQTATNGRDIWLNFMGGAAAPNTAGSFLLAAGQTYESGTNVPPGQVFLHSAADGTAVTIMEG